MPAAAPAQARDPAPVPAPVSAPPDQGPLALLVGAFAALAVLSTALPWP